MHYSGISHSGMMSNYNVFRSQSGGNLPLHPSSHGHPPPTFHVGSQPMTVKHVSNTESRMPHGLPHHLPLDSESMPRAVEHASALPSQFNAHRPGVFPSQAGMMHPPFFAQVNTDYKPSEQLTTEQYMALDQACGYLTAHQHILRLGVARDLNKRYNIPDHISLECFSGKQPLNCSSFPAHIPEPSQDESTSSYVGSTENTPSKSKRKNSRQDGAPSQKKSRRGGMMSSSIPKTMPVLSPQSFEPGNISPAKGGYNIGQKQGSLYPAGPSIPKGCVVLTAEGQPVNVEELIASGHMSRKGGLVKCSETPVHIVNMKQVSPEAGHKAPTGNQLQRGATSETHTSIADLTASTTFNELRTSCQKPQVPAEYSSMLKNILDKPSTLDFKRSQSYSYGDSNDEAVASSSLASSQFNAFDECTKPDSSQRGGAEQHCRKKAYIRQHSDDLSERSSFKLLQSGSPAMQPFHPIASTSTSMAGLFPKSMAMIHREDLASKTEAMINALTDKMDRNVDTEFATAQNTEKVDSDDDGGGRLIICEDSPNKRYSPVTHYGYDTGAEQRPSDNKGKFSS